LRYRVKVTFPHMGQLHIPLTALLQRWGIDTVVPPPTGSGIVELGARHSPEMICVPFKIALGQILKGIDAGADTVLMVGGCGPCRIGYFSQVQEEILRTLRPGVAVVTLDPARGMVDIVRTVKGLVPHLGTRELLEGLRHVWRLSKALDIMDRVALDRRWAEHSNGSVNQWLVNWTARIKGASSAEDVQHILDAALEEVPPISREVEGGKPGPGSAVPTIAVVGDIYTILDPGVNFSVEQLLADLGARVIRSVYLSDWMGWNLTPRLLRRGRGHQVARAAGPYLGHSVGGLGQDTVGNSALYSQEGVDGVLQLSPFGCTPEVVAASILPRVGREQGIPILSICIDEHTAEAGFVTRIEAFVDLLKREPNTQA